MIYQNRWHMSLLNLRHAHTTTELTWVQKTDIAIIGWGMAGLHAAKELVEAGYKVAIVEKNICWWGMSGRSGWFLTPDSELGLRQLERRYGKELTHKIWDFGEFGQRSIVNNVKEHGFVCDLQEQDSLLLWVGKAWKEAVAEEHAARQDFGYTSFLYTQKPDIQSYNSSPAYNSAVRYDNCYGINPMQYCQELKTYLISQWVDIYEFTEINKLEEHCMYANLGTLEFEQAIICPGRTCSSLNPQRAQYTFGIQNFICISEPLHPEQIAQMMPNGECMCRDTKLVFSYYRIVWGNRLLIGGWTELSSFLPWEVLYDTVIQGVVDDLKWMFPLLKDIYFPTYRSGRIEATKDLMPIIGKDKTYPNHIRVQWAVGLPRATACGIYAAQLLQWKHDPIFTDIFKEDRTFFLPWYSRNRFIKVILFGINNLRSMFRQKGY